MNPSCLFRSRVFLIRRLKQHHNHMDVIGRCVPKDEFNYKRGAESQPPSLEPKSAWHPGAEEWPRRNARDHGFPGIKVV